MSKKTFATIITLLILMIIGIILIFCAGFAVESGNTKTILGCGLGGTACCVPYMVYMR